MKEVLITIRNQAVDNKKDLSRLITSLSDGKYMVRWEKKDKRSSQQNRYLHGVMLPIIKEVLREAGWNNIKTIEDAKDFIKVKFLKYDLVNEHTGEVIEMYHNTSALTKIQFMELVQDVQIWLLDWFNVSLPMPGEQVKMFE